MFKYLFALFVLVPLAELYLLIEVGSDIGGLSTIALCLLTAAIGGLLVRIQGLQTLFRAREMMNRGVAPAEQMLHGLMIATAGLLLFLPGFITDGIGFLLLVPFVREAVGQWFVKKQFHNRGDVIIEAEIIDRKEKHIR